MKFEDQAVKANKTPNPKLIQQNQKNRHGRNGKIEPSLSIQDVVKNQTIYTDDEQSVEKLIYNIDNSKDALTKRRDVNE